MNYFQTLTINLCDNILAFYEFHLRNTENAFKFEDWILRTDSDRFPSDEIRRVEHLKLGSTTIGLLYSYKNGEMVLRITSPMLGFECGDVEYSCSVSDKSKIDADLIMDCYKKLYGQIHEIELELIQDETDFRDTFVHPLEISILGNCVSVGGIFVGNVYYYDDDHCIRLVHFDGIDHVFTWCTPGTAFQVLTSFCEMYDDQ